MFQNSEVTKNDRNIGDFRMVYLDDLESIINIIEDLNIAKILIVY